MRIQWARNISRSLRVAGTAAGLALAAGALQAGAAVQTYNLNMTGAKETNGTGTFNLGDPNGSAVGTTTLNSDNNTISWNLTLANIDPPTGEKVTGFHIHTGGPSQSSGVLIPLGVPVGSLVGNSFAGTTLLSGDDVTDLQAVMANPGGYYINIHNQEFPAGGVRDQVPEPAGLAILGLAGAALLGRRRR